MASNTVKAMTSPCASLSRAVGGGSSGFCGAGGDGWGGGGRQSVGASWRLAVRATAACSLMMDVARGQWRRVPAVCVAWVPSR